jgi:sporulation related protein/tetratricopeptide repeat protein
MFRWTLLFGVVLCCAATSSVAQAPARPLDPVFVRAQTLVSDGNGAAGRALIDSVIAVTPPTARLYPEALFWRASLAANAADAESDYRHIVVDYPLAPQAEDALLRLAQLELARGDREGALGHLQRIQRDYPRSKSLARASYWTARVLFEKNDIMNACAANANAQLQAGTSEVELRNQIQYQGQRCPTPAVAKADSPTTVPSANAAAVPASSSTPTRTTTSIPTSAAPTTPTSAPANSSQTAAASSTSVVAAGREKTAAVDSVSTITTAASTTPKTIDPAPRPKPSTEAHDSRPSVVDPTKAPKTTTSKPVAKPAAPASRASGYSVQVAAFTGKDGKVEAVKLASSLSKRGYQARVDGSVAPFRVRIGRYPTAKEAEDALRKIKPNYMDAFVVRAPER